MLNASGLNNRIHVIVPAHVVDDYGTFRRVYNDGGWRWCRIEVPRSTSTEQSGQERDYRSHVVIMRDKPLPPKKGDILENGKIRLMVSTVRPDPVNACVYLDCLSDFNEELNEQ